MLFRVSQVFETRRLPQWHKLSFDHPLEVENVKVGDGVSEVLCFDYFPDGLKNQYILYMYISNRRQYRSRIICEV